MLELARPHFIQAYWNAAEITRLRCEAAASDAAIEAAGAGAVRLDADGAMTACSPIARNWLGEYCRPWRTPARLPTVIARWVRQCQAGIADLVDAGPLVLASARGRLVVRIAWDRAGVGTLLLLDARENSAPAPNGAGGTHGPGSFSSPIWHRDA
jgi:hypothetical protein